MVKAVEFLSGLRFETIKAAKEHFSSLREATPIGDLITEPNKSDIIDAYQRYCHLTDWPAENAVDVTTQWDNKQRVQGTYAQTKAFAIVNSQGEKVIFSMDKAIEKIAI